MDPPTTAHGATAYPLELDGGGLGRLVEAALTRLAPFVDSLADQPVSGLHPTPERPTPGAEPLPRTGASVDAVLDEIFERARLAFNAASPGFMGYVPGGGLPHAAVADLISGVLNRYVGVAAAAPALVQLESDVLRWFAELIGLPADAGGVFTSGGSMANLAAIVAAREACPDALVDGLIYLSSEAHHSITKAARTAGFREDQLRTIGSGADFRLDPAALRAALRHDTAAGRKPVLVVASAGTVNTGAVDDLHALADEAACAGAWLHVDGAYGGFFGMTERGRRALRGIERADSVALDPHKTLFLPYGTGALLVREPARLRHAHGAAASYLPDKDAQLADFSDYGPELTRPFRGLRVWLPFRLHGVDAFRRVLDEKLDLAAWLAERLAAEPRLELVAPPTLSILAFAVRAPGATPAELDVLTRRLLDAVNARRRVLLTGTLLRGRFVARVAIVSFRTHRDRVEEARDNILAALDEVLPP